MQELNAQFDSGNYRLLLPQLVELGLEINENHPGITLDRVCEHISAYKLLGKSSTDCLANIFDAAHSLYTEWATENEADLRIFFGMAQLKLALATFRHNQDESHSEDADKDEEKGAAERENESADCLDDDAWQEEVNRITKVLKSVIDQSVRLSDAHVLMQTLQTHKKMEGVAQKEVQAIDRFATAFYQNRLSYLGGVDSGFDLILEDCSDEVAVLVENIESFYPLFLLNERAVTCMKELEFGDKVIWEKFKDDIELQDSIAEAYAAIALIKTTTKQGREFLQACLKIEKEYVTSIIDDVSGEMSKGGNRLRANDACAQLKEMTSVIHYILSGHHTSEDKVQRLQQFEKRAKKKPFRCKKCVKYLAAFLATAVALVLGGVVGAVIAGATFAATGPGAVVAAVAGSAKGAAVGASIAAVVAGSGCSRFFKKRPDFVSTAKQYINKPLPV